MKNISEFELAIFTDENMCDFLETYKSLEECQKRIEEINREFPLTDKEHWSLVEYVKGDLHKHHSL